MNIKFKIKQNILHRVADNLDEEIDEYIVSVLTGFKNISGLNSKFLRRQIYEENKEEITNDMINILQDEINQLKEDNKKLIRKNTFKLSESQETKIDAWKKIHDCVHRESNQGAIGGRYTYEFIPTSIGVFCTIKCSCGKELDVSEV